MVGSDLEEFRRYYRTLSDIHEYFKALRVEGVEYGELGAKEEGHIRSDPSHLIVWREGREIIGHAIWHETNTDEHRSGDPRDNEDRETLRSLLGGKREHIVELHELWLKTNHRGKGHGKEFFSFFEDFIREKGYEVIVYYSDNPAAIAICRKRGYREAIPLGEGWHTFALLL